MDESKRIKILEAATMVFAEKGYQYATIADIAKEAGISTGLLYSYFENKLDVLLSIVLYFLNEINNLNIERLDSLNDPVKKLHALLQNFEEMLLKNDYTLSLTKVLHEAHPHTVMIKDEGLKKKRLKIMKANRYLVATIDEIMRYGQEQGVFDDSLKPSAMRQVLMGTMERMIYGLFFKTFTSGEIGYDRDDAHDAIMLVIEKFIRK
ncbi:TetR/AcrR family transcriptional regulator [Spirochaetota bacterium]